MISLQFSEFCKSKFFAIFKKLNYEYGCTYFSYYLEILNLKKIYAFTTDQEWSNLFVSEKLMLDCPLMNLGWENKKIILDWDTAPIINSKQRRVVSLRSEFGYGKGISFSNNVFGIKESLGFATHDKNKEFKKIIIDDIENFSKILIEFSSISYNFIEQDIDNKKFLFGKDIMPLYLLSREIWSN